MQIIHVNFGGDDAEEALREQNEFMRGRIIPAAMELVGASDPASPDFPEAGSLEEAVDRHPVGKGVAEARRALLDARKWSNRIDIARKAYAEALIECRRQGLSNSEIARTVGKSEAAIRMLLRRRGQ